ncbi:hypothetical protein [Metapseudomonas furukawaii]|uniref:hypothetical protein n=1 Tax=Metapseudomonas furukawaii TaxID=1149133 RepID=UPI00103EBB86|nr:hypothetical protein [Pseudomonas furukawaii]
MSFGACANKTNSPLVTAAAHGRQLVIRNVKGKIISKVEVDGCVVTDNSPRCDYLFEIDAPMKKVIYLELKGKDVEKAYSQLCATMDRFSVRHAGLIKDCHIVASRVPKSGPKTQVLKVRMLKDYGARLFVNTTRHQVDE